ncbi:MAG: RIP metalloprotease RseP [Gammaproteobacteria bacterium]|nr:MAG: RIP metalloprotease RseP [Gammaproteobacteria bacterium]
MIDFLNQLPTPLISLIGFIVTISFLVTIHEYGHFWVARRFGVKIEKFSIGFGKPIIKWHGRRDNTEYCIAWIPLGGYVKMHGEHYDDIRDSQAATGCDSHSEAHHDISDITDVGDVDTTGKDVANDEGSFLGLPAWKRFLIAFAGPGVNLFFAVFALWLLFIIGIPALSPYIGSVERHSPLYGHVEAGDRIVSIDGNRIETLTDTVIHLVDNMGNPTTTITVVDSDNISKQAVVDLSHLPDGSELDIEKALGFHWEIAEVGQRQPATVDSVVIGSPSDKAGLQTDDVIIRANDKPIANWQDFVTVVQANPNTAVVLLVKRNGHRQQLILTPAPHRQHAAIGYAGVRGRFDPSIYDKYRTKKKYSAIDALPMAVRENYLQGKLIVKMLGRLVTGQASIKNMGGPISIADYSGKSLQMGYVTFFKFLAAISLTLAVMNLLPIPVLDGGHMMICTIEMIRGKALSERATGLLMRLGLSLMLAFMAIVIGVDLWKYLLN